MGLTTTASSEMACSEARLAPRGKATNEVSVAIPPDKRSASGGTSHSTVSGYLNRLGES